MVETREVAGRAALASGIDMNRPMLARGGRGA